MKLIFTILVVLIMFLAGCGESNKVETAPWTDSQIGTMDDIEVVPFAIWTF